uniref:Uncharacterized protein n=1 Tax=Cacopsylla melanoneura TaxID=428564 RepID=A0A8D8XQH4_9HEMI
MVSPTQPKRSPNWQNCTLLVLKRTTSIMLTTHITTRRVASAQTVRVIRTTLMRLTNQINTRMVATAHPVTVILLLRIIRMVAPAQTVTVILLFEKCIPRIKGSCSLL